MKSPQRHHTHRGSAQRFLQGQGQTRKPTLTADPWSWKAWLENSGKKKKHQIGGKKPTYIWVLVIRP